jgi:hypothetical protein
MANEYEISDEELEDEREYTEREIAIRQKFVDQYLFDYDPLAAAIRVGWPKEYAKEMSQRFMEEPYVLNEIKKRETKALIIDSDNPEAAKQQEAELRQYVLQSLIKQANYYGPGSSHAGRVAALAQISKLQGLEAATRIKQEINTTNGEGVFVVPGVVNAEDWAKMAAEHQAQLAEEVTKH